MAVAIDRFTFPLAGYVEKDAPLHEVLQAAFDRRAQDTREALNVGSLAIASGLPSARIASTISGRRFPSHEELNLLAMAIGLNAEDRKFLQSVRQRELAIRKQKAEEQAREAIALNGTPSPEESRRARSSPDFPPSQRARSTPDFPPLPTGGQPDPLPISKVEELIQALNDVHLWAGSPSLRELEQQNGKLRRSTVSEMLRRQESIPKYEQYMAFLQACGIEGRYLDDWVFTWRRLKALERSGQKR